MPNMKKYYLSVLSFCFCLILKAQGLQSPTDFLGYALGEAFTPHHKVVSYFEYLDGHSDQLRLQSYGTTYEGRPLIVALISSAENIAKLKTIQNQHHKIKSFENEPNINNKTIVWLSYNVHGNEASSTEAAMKTAYDLISQRQDWLNDMVVILDPCLNPDGRDRYVHFFKQHKSNHNKDAENTVARQENWPNGRSNHYQFDLNRDWAWVSQQESQARIALYNKWLPHVHIDFHEQGINSNYYFAPAAKPMHTLITPFQKDFQKQIGKNNARYFDAMGRRYFTKEVFDLLYPSYGDTYPTFLGAIGMTYEQAGGGIAGLNIIKENTLPLSLKDRILGHYTTGISSLEVVFKNKIKLLENRQAYFQQDLEIKTFVMEGQEQALMALEKLLHTHDIETARLGAKQNLKGFDYQNQQNGFLTFDSSALVVTTMQKKGLLAHVLLEPTTTLEDSLTYDITAWSLPYAYGLKALASKNVIETNPINIGETPSDTIPNKAYGVALPLAGLQSSKFLAAALKENLFPRYTLNKVEVEGRQWPAGSLFFLKDDHLMLEAWINSLYALATKHQLRPYVFQTGWAQKGPDLGAASFKAISKPNVALLKNEQMDTYGYGETWHFFEQELNYPLLRFNKSALLDQLHTIDILLFPEGNYDAIFDDLQTKQLISWVEKGGKIIAWGNALDWFSQHEVFALEVKPLPENNTQKIAFDQWERNEISRSILGSIYKTHLDQSHPINFGVERFFTLRQNPSTYALLENGYNASYLTNKAKPLNGFIGYEQKKQQPNSFVYGQIGLGKGSVIYFVDNPLFRSFWYQGKVAFFNAVFLTF